MVENTLSIQEYSQKVTYLMGYLLKYPPISLSLTTTSTICLPLSVSPFDC